MIHFCMMDDDDTVVGQWHEPVGGSGTVWRIRRQDQKNWMVVDVVKNLDDSQQLEAGRED